MIAFMSEPLNAAVISRRRALGLFTGLLTGATHTLAQNTEGLLPPQAIGTTVSSTILAGGGMPDGRSPLDGLHAGEGRGVATTTVEQIDTLALNLANLEKSAKDIRTANEQREARLRDLIAERDIKLDEYRAGLFCSGCGQTKSEILKKKEQFPHPGQTIIAATPEQIRAKERELQGPIDSMRRVINSALDQLNDLRKQRDEALEQIYFGIAYWQTGYSYQITVLQLKLQVVESKYAAKAEEISKLISQLEHELFMVQQQAKRDPKTAKNTTKSNNELLADIRLWNSKLKDVEISYQKDKRQLESDLRDARLRAGQDESLLMTSLTRPELIPILTVVPKANQLSPFARPDELGLKFHLGNFSPSISQDVYPSVKNFIEKFRNLSSVAIATGTQLGGDSGALVNAPSTLLNIQTTPSSIAPSPSGSNQKVPDRLLNLP